MLGPAVIAALADHVQQGRQQLDDRDLRRESHVDAGARGDDKNASERGGVRTSHDGPPPWVPT